MCDLRKRETNGELMKSSVCEHLCKFPTRKEMSVSFPERRGSRVSHLRGLEFPVSIQAYPTPMASGCLETRIRDPSV